MHRFLGCECTKEWRWEGGGCRKMERRHALSNGYRRGARKSGKSYIKVAMLSKKCPHCAATIKLKDCISLLYDNFACCKYCQKKFQIKRKTMYVHAAILGFVIALMAKVILNASIVECAIYSVIFSVVFQRFIDFFYDLEPVKE